ncbi:MAG: response regulator [Rhizobiaceae bacterium]|nr:response regulator [Rhizobiaceae bacterium]
MTEPRKLQDRVAAAFGGAPSVAADAGFAAIHDALGDLTLCRDADGVILSANRSFREMSGVDDPVGRTCAELDIAFKSGAVPHIHEVEFTTAGRRRIFLWQDIAIRDPGNGVSRLQSIARDITAERLRAEAAEQASRAAEEESQRKSRLIAMVSHEIRTPLSGLLGMGQLLGGTELTPEQANYLDGIRRSGTDLAQLVEDLLDFSTLAAGRFHLRPSRQAVRPLVESVVELLSSRAHAKGIEIAAVIDPGLPDELEFDVARFRQVLYNVIGNAVKFTEQGGVLVRAARGEDALEVRVEDTGPGMNDGELKRIFGAFEQGDLSRAREGGVGLGLAISARIMAEAGGGISVESAPGHGTAFTIRLKAPASGAGLRSGRELSAADVLLLAPAGPAAMAISACLANLGARVRSATDLDAALRQLALRPVNGVIVDHRLDSKFTASLARSPAIAGARKVFLVSPESRPATMSGDVYDSWLIRPLREQSLIDVLTGKLRGLEPRPEERREFPVLAAEASDESDAVPSRAEPAAAARPGIILAEDDPINAFIVRSMLEKAGLAVRSVTSFERLAALHAEDPAALIVTDNSLDDGTCGRFVATLRGREDAGLLPVTPVIVLTADGRQETRRDLLTRGANLVLVKPARADSLVSAVMDLLGRRAA